MTPAPSDEPTGREATADLPEAPEADPGPEGGPRPPEADGGRTGDHSPAAPDDGAPDNAAGDEPGTGTPGTPGPPDHAEADDTDGDIADSDEPGKGTPEAADPGDHTPAATDDGAPEEADPGNPGEDAPGVADQADDATPGTTDSADPDEPGATTPEAAADADPDAAEASPGIADHDPDASADDTPDTADPADDTPGTADPTDPAGSGAGEGSGAAGGGGRPPQNVAGSPLVRRLRAGPGGADGPRRANGEVATRPRLQRAVDALTIGGVLLLGALAVGIGIAHERGRASQRDEQAAARAAAAIADEADRSLVSLSGAAGLAVDGTVTPEEFDAYATDVIRATNLPTLGLASVVPAGRREAFEEDSGLQVRDLVGDKLVPAGDRDEYLPLVDVVPDDDTHTAVLGFDLASEGARREATAMAAEQRRAVLGAAIELTTDGSNGFFLVQPLFARTSRGEERLVGYVSSSLQAEGLVAAARADVPDGTSVAISEAGTTLAGDPTRGESVEARMAGRSWMVVADHPRGPGVALPGAIGSATFLLAGLLVFSSRRDRRHQRAIDRLARGLAEDAERATALATVARALSFSSDSDSFVRIVTTDVGPVVGADAADVGLLRTAEFLTMSPRRATGGTPTLPRRRRVPLDWHLPAIEAVRERRLVAAEDLADYLRDDAELLAEVEADGLASTVATPLFGNHNEPTGVLSFVWRRPTEVDEGTLAVIETLARLCGQALRRIQLAERTAQLAGVAASMAVASSPADVARRLTEEASHALGAVHVNLRLIAPATATLDALVETPLPGGLDLRYRRVPLDAPVPLSEAVRDDRPVWVADLDDWRRRYPDAAEDADRAGFPAVAALPLHDSRGEAIGAVAFAWPTAMRFDPDLVSHVATIADIAAQTLERTRLAANHQRRAEALAALAQTLATSLSRAGVAEAVADHVSRLLDTADVTLTVEAGVRALQPLVARTGGGGGATRRGRQVPVDRDAPVTDAYRSGEALMFPDAAACRECYPQLGDAAVAPGVEGSAHLPLRDAEGQVRGVLSTGWATPVAFDPPLRTLMATVADLVGLTLERATLHEDEHAVVTTLQRRLLTAPPEVAGLDVAVHYEPASGDVGIGGDWYDTVALDDGGLVVVVGDVTGHGVQAVAAMTQLRYLIAGLVRTGTPLDRVFAQANDMVAGDDIFASALLLHVDHRWRRLGHLRAGHPPALLRYPDGSVTALTGAHQPLIGTPLRPRRPDYVDLPPGSLVLAYTDGLVERRTQALSTGIERLRQDLAEAGDGPTRALLERLVDTARRSDADGVPLDDDVAAVLIRSCEPATDPTIPE